MGHDALVIRRLGVLRFPHVDRSTVRVVHIQVERLGDLLLHLQSLHGSDKLLVQVQLGGYLPGGAVDGDVGVDVDELLVCVRVDQLQRLERLLAALVGAALLPQRLHVQVARRLGRSTVLGPILPTPSLPQAGGTFGYNFHAVRVLTVLLNFDEVLMGILVHGL